MKTMIMIQVVLSSPAWPLLFLAMGHTTILCCQSPNFIKLRSKLTNQQQTAATTPASEPTTKPLTTSVTSTFATATANTPSTTSTTSTTSTQATNTAAVTLTASTATTSSTVTARGWSGCGYTQYNNSGSGPGIGIVGGRNAAEFGFPWQALIWFYSRAQQRSASCGGTLIDKSWVLAAAVCCSLTSPIGIADNTVYLGNTNRFGAWLYVENPTAIYIHPQYNATSNAYPFCLLRIPTVSTNFLWAIQSICLPFECSSSTNVKALGECDVGQTISLAGWGNNGTASSVFPLQTINQSIVDSATCRTVYPDFDPTNQMCAGGAAGQAGCLNDPGGAGVCYIDGRAVAHGVFAIARSPKCDEAGFPNIYGRVCAVRQWIDGFLNQPAVAATTPTTLAPPINFSKCGLTKFNNTGQGPGMAIVGGRSAIIDEVPWHAFIVSNSSSINPLYGGGYAGGVLISDSWVLTSAMDGCNARLLSDIRVSLGGNQLGNFLYEQPAVAVFKHPSWNTTYWRLNNLCLIKIPQVDLTSSWSIQPICMPQQCDSNYECQPLSMASTSGFGWATISRGNLSTFLQVARLRVIGRRECQAFIYDVDNAQICAGWDRGTNVCTGDLGGPLWCFINGRYILNGIMSYPGFVCGATGDTPVFMRVCAYKSWINDIMRNN